MDIHNRTQFSHSSNWISNTQRFLGSVVKLCQVMPSVAQISKRRVCYKLNLTAALEAQLFCTYCDVKNSTISLLAINIDMKWRVVKKFIANWNGKILRVSILSASITTMKQPISERSWVICDAKFTQCMQGLNEHIKS